MSQAQGNEKKVDVYVNATTSTSPQQTTQKPALSQAALENIKAIEEAQAKQGKYIKLNPGERKVLYFDPDKMKTVETEFTNDKGQKTHQTKVQFSVIDPDIPQEEKLIELSMKHTKTVIELIKKGYRTLDVVRVGSGLQTSYTVTPAG